MKLPLLLLFFSLAARAASPPPSSLEEIAASPGWLRVLHYKNHWVTGRRSAADGEGFFLSDRGARDPLAELVATIGALERGGGSYGKLQQPAGCAFPARKDFLERALGRRFPEDPCPALEAYLAKLKPRAVSLVFATAYAGNPASMFGHSFFKIASGGSDLLDWSVNYAAMVPPDENGFAFAYFGLTGGYQGQFALVPYYAKIEEYGYLEGRDMWEYELALSPGEILSLVRAIWELETNSHFQYYFFDENCSYQILTLLEIVRPDWDVSGYFLHLIPGESVKRVAKVPGAVKSVRMRPSLERRVRVTAERMSEEERRAFFRAREEGPAGLGGRSLEAYLLFLRAEKKRKGEKWSVADAARFAQALRLEAAEREPAPKIGGYGGERGRPDLSHGAYQIGLGPVYTAEERWGGELSVRLAYHDLLDSDLGYLAHSEVLFPNFRFRYAGGRFSLHEAELFSLVSLTPWNLLRRPLAWRADFSYGEFLDSAAKGLHGSGGVGAAWAPLPERWTVWSMVGGAADWSAAWERAARASAWLELGSLLTFPGEGKILFELRGGRVFFSRHDWILDGKLGLSQPLSTDWALRWESRAAFPSQASSRSDHRVLAVHYF